MPTPPAVGWTRRAGEPERSRTRSATRGSAAAFAGQGGGVAGSRCLHEHGAVGDTLADRLEGRTREPGADGAVLARDDIHPGPAPHCGAGGHQVVGPSPGEEVVGLDGAGETGDESSRALLLGAHEEHVSCVGVGSARLGVETAFVDATDPAAILGALRPNTRAVYSSSVWRYRSYGPQLITATSGLTCATKSCVLELREPWCGTR